MSGALDLGAASAEDTMAIGSALARLLVPGDVISLSGDLGAGKTTFVQGAAAALGVTEPVLSPTFTLVREYRGTLAVYHLDVYRLDRLQEVLDLGFEEILDQGGVVFVEWGDAIEALLPDSHLRIEMVIPPDGGGRRLLVDCQGSAWVERRERLAELLQPWEGPRP
jgi:tRNA threonylcarbamoyladenosine biosynthesis protein TsaE